MPQRLLRRPEKHLDFALAEFQPLQALMIHAHGGLARDGG